MTRHETNFTREARFPTSAYDEASRTVQAVITTGADVKRKGRFGPYIERLNIDAISLEALTGIPVQIDHDTSVRASIGKVIAARRDPEGIVATIQLSTAPDVAPIVDRIRDGTLESLSIGYSVSRWSERKE